MKKTEGRGFLFEVLNLDSEGKRAFVRCSRFFPLSFLLTSGLLLMLWVFCQDRELYDRLFCTVVLGASTTCFAVGAIASFWGKFSMQLPWPHEPFSEMTKEGKRLFGLSLSAYFSCFGVLFAAIVPCTIIWLTEAPSVFGALGKWLNCWPIALLRKHGAKSGKEIK